MGRPCREPSRGWTQKGTKGSVIRIRWRRRGTVQFSGELNCQRREEILFLRIFQGLDPDG